MVIDNIQCYSAEELLAAVSWNNLYWKGASYSDVGFRGQGNAQWDLLPTAFRDGGIVGLNAVPGPLQRVVDQTSAEILALHEFLELADSIGLPVPGDNPVSRRLLLHRERASEDFSDFQWPPIDILETLAIAQHHGIPTRLLDFTYEPKVAAFFAAESAVVNQGDKNKAPDLAVWVVDLRFIRRVWQFAATDQERIKEVKVPRAYNQYLNAQDGIFLFDAGANVNWEDGTSRAIDSIVCQQGDYWGGQQGVWPGDLDTSKVIPLVTKITAPGECAAAILSLLEQGGLTSAHIRPSYDNVVKKLKLRWRQEHN